MSASQALDVSSILTTRTEKSMIFRVSKKALGALSRENRSPIEQIL